MLVELSNVSQIIKEKFNDISTILDNMKKRKCLRCSRTWNFASPVKKYMFWPCWNFTLDKFLLFCLVFALSIPDVKQTAENAGLSMYNK